MNRRVSYNLNHAFKILRSKTYDQGLQENKEEQNKRCQAPSKILIALIP